MGEKLQTATDLVAPALSEGRTTSGEKQQRGFVSKGEHIHKWGTYLSVDWVLNAAAGVTFAYWAEFNKIGQKIWSTPITNFFEGALKPIIKDPEKLTKSAKNGNLFMSIIAGGMFTIPPLMALEHRKVKKKITQFFDGQIYGKDKVANDPRFQKAYDEIDNAPKKDFWNGMSSRFVALAPLLAIILYPKSKQVADDLWFKHFKGASKWAAEKLGVSYEKAFKSVSREKAALRLDTIHNGIAMDLGLGLPYAGLHSLFYNMFTSRKKKEGVKEVLENSQIAATLPDTLLTSGNKKLESDTPRRIASFTARESAPKSFTERAGMAQLTGGQDLGSAR